ncbi:MAG: hypothetical protein ACLT8E_01085 [Akkermansia sp.]
MTTSRGSSRRQGHGRTSTTEWMCRSGGNRRRRHQHRLRLQLGQLGQETIGPRRKPRPKRLSYTKDAAGGDRHAA